MNRAQLEQHDKRFHENTLKRLINNILTNLIIALSYLPFWVLFRISDLLYWVLRFVIKYRFKVITENLRNAFPEKTEKEISEIRNKFYSHFCDLIVESIKTYSISNKEMEKRVLFKGIEEINAFFDEGRSIIALAMHHSNWEWTGFVQPKLKHLILPVYNPIRGNQAMEKFITHNRERWGSESIPVHKTARTLIEYSNKGRLTGLYLVADQTPPANSKFWTIFLNQETPFFSGPEKIAASGNLPVLFQHTKKVGRGKYIIEFSLLFENPAEVEQKDILLAYIRKCEEIIREEPAYYLWSHRRWKHTRPEGIELTM